MKFPALFAALAVLALPHFSATVRAHEAADAMSAAANNFLNALDKDQRSKASHDFDADERKVWAFIPLPFEGEGVRTGLPIKEMRQDQRALAFGLLSSGLSHRGFSQAVTIMSLEQVLWEMENQSPKRNPEMYYVTIYGKPGSKTWGWRVEGHHLSLHFSVVDGNVAGTPSFYATNPGTIQEGPRKGLQVLAAEEDIARELVNSLDKVQIDKAIFSDAAPKDILTGADTEINPLGKEGVLAGELTDGQQATLQQLIEVYVHRVRPSVAAEELKKIEEAGFEKILFAWAGGIKKGEGHYYRVQGPTFLLEYANTQNDANHVHAVWRDFANDFGEDLLRAHFKAEHKEPVPAAK